MTARKAGTATWSGEWHPLAGRFPMRSEDELRSMAESIAQDGQLYPCIMTAAGLGLDGRNRVAACQIAGVEPLWQATADEAVGVIMRGNDRRQQKPGQYAMGVALAMEARGLRQNGRWKRGSVPEAPKDTRGTTSTRWADVIAQCGVILDHRPDLADDVLFDRLALDAAYRLAVEKRDADRQRAELTAGLPPDLLALVDSGVRDLADAAAEAEHRTEVDAADQVRTADLAPAPTFGERALSSSLSWGEAASLASRWLAERRESMDRDRERIRRINSAWGVVETIRHDRGTLYMKELLEGLGEADRQALRLILGQIGETR